MGQLSRGIDQAALWALAQTVTQPRLVRLGGSLVWVPVLPGEVVSPADWAVTLAAAYAAAGFTAGFLGRLAGARVSFGPAAGAGHAVANGLAASFGHGRRS